MILVVNAGSGAVPPSGDGWTNTREGALREARRWHDLIEADGIRDVAPDDAGEDLGDGRWRFTFRHEVTGAVVHLDTHGVDDLKAYEREHVFPPRVYWNGSSTGGPQVEDWAAGGYEVVKTHRPVGGGARAAAHGPGAARGDAG